MRKLPDNNCETMMTADEGYCEIVKLAGWGNAITDLLIQMIASVEKEYEWPDEASEAIVLDQIIELEFHVRERDMNDDPTKFEVWMGDTRLMANF